MTKTLSTSAEELLPQNKLRKSFIIQNEDATINVFVRFGERGTPAVSSTVHDHRIGPGAVLSVNSMLDGMEQIQGRVTIVAASGTPLVSFFETEDKVR